jgi:hypothetical protein
MDSLAHEIAAGRMTPSQAVDVLIQQSASADMPESQRSELRSLLEDLLANDPHLVSLVQRM